MLLAALKPPAIFQPSFNSDWIASVKSTISSAKADTMQYVSFIFILTFGTAKIKYNFFVMQVK